MAPSAGLLLLALSAAGLSRAAGVPSCTRSPSGDPEAVPSLDDVMTCQREVRGRLAAGGGKGGGAATGEQLDRLDEAQRREVRDFLRRHPDGGQSRRPPQDDLGPPKDFVGYLKEAFDALAAKAWSWLGVPDPAAKPKETSAQALKRVLDAAKRDAQGQQAAEGLGSVEKGPGEGGPEPVARAVRTYNQRLNESLDPAMRKYFKSKGQKAEEAAQPSEGRP